MEETRVKYLLEEFGGTYTLGEDGMLYPDLTIEAADRPIGKWGRMHEHIWKPRTRFYTCSLY